jgi:2-polyprenyl-3-methyl-5-hydroxy-6-metoxy-1,4-benzoquinol methylase
MTPQENTDYFDVNSILENVPCNICGSNNFTVKKKSRYNKQFSIESFITSYSSSSDISLQDQLVKCNNCCLTYVNPRISSSLSLQGYVKAIDERHHEQDEYRIKSFKRALKKIKLFTELEKNKTEQSLFLDVGCAGGAFLKAANDFGYEAIGIEPSNYLAAIAKQKYGLEVYQKTLDEFNISDINIFVISLWDVLEHVPDPTLTLRKAHSLLDDEGVLILNIPMIDSWPARLLGSKWPFYLGVHVYYFNKNSIKNILENTGFKIQKIIPYTQTLSLGYIIARAGVPLPKILSNLLRVPFTYYLGQRTIIAKKNA